MLRLLLAALFLSGSFAKVPSLEELMLKEPTETGWKLQVEVQSGELILAESSDSLSGYVIRATKVDDGQSVVMSAKLYQEVMSGKYSLLHLLYLKTKFQERYRPVQILRVDKDFADQGSSLRADVAEETAVEMEDGPATFTETSTNVWNLAGGVSNKGLHRSSTATSTSVKISKPGFKLDPSLPRFRSLRLDLEALLRIRESRKGSNTPKLGLSSADLADYLKMLKETGIDTLVLAYAQANDTFFYKPAEKFSYLKGPKREKTIPAAENIKSSLLDGKDLIATLLKEAADNGIKVYLGLGVPGDPLLLRDLGNQGAGLPLTMPQTAALTLEQRLKQGIEAAKEQAADLQAQYGKQSAFYGWYLGPPMSCFEAMKFLAPVAASLRGLGGDKKIVAAASVHAKVCDPKGAPRAIVLKENEKSFDAVSYQDNIESAAIPEVRNGAELVVEHFERGDCGSELCRDKLRKLLPSLYGKIAASHQKSTVAYWVETQGTRRKALCPLEADECPAQASALPWSFAQRQLEQALSLVGDPGRVLWNGGLSVLNVSEKTDILDFEGNARAKDLTTAYRNYLNTPQFSTLPAPPETLNPVVQETGACTLSPESTRKDGRIVKLEEEYFQTSSSKTMAGMPRVQALCGTRADKILEEECGNAELKSVSVVIRLEKILADGTRQAQKPYAVGKDCAK